MREIKFRAWDKKYEQMLQVLTIKELCVTHIALDELKNLEIMQYTGLKDINGVEIYEGDIVKVYNKKSKFFDDMAKVVFYNSAFMLKSVDFEDDHIEFFINHPFSLYRQENYKVIGNIYESKELLNA